jgi:hypothetical protein
MLFERKEKGCFQGERFLFAWKSVVTWKGFTRRFFLSTERVFLHTTTIKERFI